VVWIARANACSAPRTSPKSGSERFMVKKKERAANMCARTTRRKSDRLRARVRVCERTKRQGERSTSMLTPAGQAPSPAVPNTSSRRTLSDAFASRWSAHAATAWKALRTALAAGHAYAGTRESI
jgi:hypothetical protein